MKAFDMYAMPEPTTKEKLLLKVEKEIERIFPDSLEKDEWFTRWSSKTYPRDVKDIVLYRNNVFNKVVKGLTTKHLTGLVSKMKQTPVWSK